MKKNRLSRIFAYLLHQLWNERRANLPLFAELLIVSSIVWYLVDCTFVVVSTRLEPTGFDATNCFKLSLGTLNEGSVGYDATRNADDEDAVVADYLALIDRVRHDPDVEAAAYSIANDPYNGSRITSMFTLDTLSLNARLIFCQPDFVRVFRYQGADGQTPDQLASLFRQGETLVSTGAFGPNTDLHPWLRKPAIDVGDSLRWSIAGLIQPVKRFTWEEMADAEVFLVPLTNANLAESSANQISLSVRVGDAKANAFEQHFRQKIKNQRMRVGNIYVSDVTSYDRLRHDTESAQDAALRNHLVGIAFLLVNVFLGLLGTFWFRTQQRFPEIGVEKALGATNADIGLRLFAEAAAITTLAFLVSLVIDVNIALAGLTNDYGGTTFTVGRFACSASVAYLLLFVIIALGIWLPTVWAARTNPVDVLRGE